MRKERRLEAQRRRREFTSQVFALTAALLTLIAAMINLMAALIRQRLGGGDSPLRILHHETPKNQGGIIWFFCTASGSFWALR